MALEWVEGVNQLIGETLRYLGESGFTIFNSGMKVVIDFSDGRVLWFLYKSYPDEYSIVGAVVLGLMNYVREDESPASHSDE